MALVLNCATVPVEDAYIYAQEQCDIEEKMLSSYFSDFYENYSLLQNKCKEALDLPRIEMPVIEPEHMDDFKEKIEEGSVDVAPPYAYGEKDELYPTDLTMDERGRMWLAKGLMDGNFSDDEIQATNTLIAVGDLIPTQSQIWLEKVVGMSLYFGPLNQDSDFLREAPIIVSSEGYILDGHHRFGAAMVSNPSLKLSALKVDMPIRELVKMARSYGNAIGNEQKAAESFNADVELDEKIEEVKRHILYQAEYIIEDFEETFSLDRIRNLPHHNTLTRNGDNFTYSISFHLPNGPLNYRETKEYDSGSTHHFYDLTEKSEKLISEWEGKIKDEYEVTFRGIEVRLDYHRARMEVELKLLAIDEDLPEWSMYGVKPDIEYRRYWTKAKNWAAESFDAENKDDLFPPIITQGGFVYRFRADIPPTEWGRGDRVAWYCPFSATYDSPDDTRRCTQFILSEILRSEQDWLDAGWDEWEVYDKMITPHEDASELFIYSGAETFEATSGKRMYCPKCEKNRTWNRGYKKHELERDEKPSDFVFYVCQKCDYAYDPKTSQEITDWKTKYYDAETFNADEDEELFDCAACDKTIYENDDPQDDEICDDCLKTHKQCSVCQDYEPYNEMTSCFICGQNYCGACDKYDSCEGYSAETEIADIDCVNVVSKKAAFSGAGKRFYRVSFRDKTLYDRYATPAWATRAAETMGVKYFNVSGSLITLGQLPSGKWEIQAVLIPNEKAMTKRKALKMANHMQDRIEREGKWAKKKCREDEIIEIYETDTFGAEEDDSITPRMTYNMEQTLDSIWRCGDRDEVSIKHIYYTLGALADGRDWDTQTDYTSMNQQNKVKRKWKKIQAKRDELGVERFKALIDATKFEVGKWHLYSAESLSADIEMPHMETGDTILVGKYRNKPEIIEGQGVDKNKQPVLLTKTPRGRVTKERKMLPYHIAKLKNAESFSVNRWGIVGLSFLTGVVLALSKGEGGSDGQA